MRISVPIFRLILIFPIFSVFSNCYKPVEGCLEIEATNFQATADENCCCEYPNLKFVVEQYFGQDSSVVFIPQKFYVLENGDSLKINAITFYLSDFQLVRNAETFEVSDTAHLQTFPDGTKSVFKNDFLIVRRTPSEFLVGEFLPTGSFSALNFRFGLTDSANKINPKSAPTGHPLAAQGEKMWENEADGYRFLMLAFERDTVAATPPDTIYWTKKDFQQLNFSATGNFEHAVGFDFTLKFRVDFEKWFAGVQLSQTDNLQLKSKIVSNLPSSFSISQ